MFKLRKSDDGAAFEKARRRWQKTRERGKFWFVLMRGVMGFGGTCFAFDIGIQILTDHGINSISIEEIAVAAGIWCIVGIFWGSWQWRWLGQHFGNSRGDDLSISPGQSK